MGPLRWTSVSRPTAQVPTKEDAAAVAGRGMASEPIRTETGEKRRRLVSGNLPT
jgi:hypothetical protein